MFEMKYYKVPLYRYKKNCILKDDTKVDEVIVYETILGTQELLTGKYFPKLRRSSIEKDGSSFFVLDEDFTCQNLATQEEIRAYVQKGRPEKGHTFIKKKE